MTEVVAAPTTHDAAADMSWRQVFATDSPWRVVRLVVLLAAAVYGFEIVLITQFDARVWWGKSLVGMATAFAVVLVVAGLLVWHRAARLGAGRRLIGFLFFAWIGVSLVSWLPRQRPTQWPELAQLGWWAGWCIVIYVSIPVLYARLNGHSLRSYGLRLGLFRGEMRIFAVLLPIIVVGAYLAAGQPRFQEVYPFYRDWTAGRGTLGGLLVWWSMYAATFVALEFFYRGFMVSAGFRIVQWWAVPVMAAPYCLLHLDKPVPEMLTSLMGGLVLGVVAVRTRSILAGVLAHVTLALGTDAAVLTRR